MISEPLIYVRLKSIELWLSVAGLDREQLQLHVCVLRLVRLMLSSRYWHAHNGTYALVTNPRPIADSRTCHLSREATFFRRSARSPRAPSPGRLRVRLALLGTRLPGEDRVPAFLPRADSRALPVARNRVQEDRRFLKQPAIIDLRSIRPDHSIWAISPGSKSAR